MNARYISQSNLRAVFRLEGQFWRIAYNSPEFFLKSYIGCGYIHSLLAQSTVEISASELVIRCRGKQPILSSMERHAIQDALNQGDLSLRSSDDTERILSRASETDVFQRLEKARGELLKLQAEGNVADAVALADDISNLEKFLKRFKNRAFNNTLPNQTERNRISVRKAITGAIKVIGSHNPRLARHLNNSISTGEFCGYYPEFKIDWQL